ncbi:MAG: DUF1232 domain-containing protein [Ignavibacteriales bacterium]|nr:DUF1232 domain-containing protein [Ignavibacteriales bacterium]
MSYDIPLSTEERYRREAEYVADRFEEKLRRVGKNIRFANHLIALFRYMTDPEVHWARKSIVVAALLYFIIPLDSIPDFTPVVGFLDDIGVVAAVIKYLGSQLTKYYDS